LPPARWQPEQLERLGSIVQDALNAADLSAQTASQLERLLVNLLPFQLEWAAGWIQKLIKERGQINWFGIGSRISNPQARAVAAQLLPVVQAWQTREREPQIIQLFQQLGQRMRELSDFLELAEQMVTHSSQTHTSRAALGLICAHDPARFRRLVPELLQADPSWATVELVYLHLHHHRQDLLTPFLGRTAYSGRFSTGKTRFVLPVSSGFQRWNPAQHHSFVQTLEEVVLDSERDIPAILRVLVQLARIPNASLELISLLAEESNPRPAVRDAALRALGRLDEARGLEALLRAMEDSRARVAIYALRGLFLGMAQSTALEMLKRAPLERVTVAKEVLRLIGELKSESAYAYLLERSLPVVAPQKPLHRDVRVALLRALWDYLEDERTWELFFAAAADPDPAIADSVIRIPIERLSGGLHPKLITLLVTLLAHPDPDVRLETLQRMIYGLPIQGASPQLVRPLLEMLHSKMQKQIFLASQVFFTSYTGSNTGSNIGSDTGSNSNTNTNYEIVQEAFTSLLTDRQSLHSATEAVLTCYRIGSENQHSKGNSSARAVLAALSSDPNTLAIQIRMVFQFLPIKELGAFVITLADQAQLHADNYQITKTALFHLTQQRSYPQQNLQTLEQVWVDHPHETVRRLALESLILRCARTGWTAENLQQLERYRQDPSSLVAAAAQFIFPVLILEPNLDE
jgi:HEAT repeat protein